MSHEEANVEPRVSKQYPSQVTIFPSWHAFDVEYVDLLVYDPNLVVFGVVDLGGLAWKGLDRCR